MPDTIAPAVALFDGAAKEVVTFNATVNTMVPQTGPTRGDTLVTVFGVGLTGPRNLAGYPVSEDGTGADDGAAQPESALVPFCVFGGVEVVASAVAVVDQVLSSDATRAKLLAEEADLMAQIAAAEAEELWSAAEWEVRRNANSE